MPRQGLEMLLPRQRRQHLSVTFTPSLHPSLPDSRNPPAILSLHPEPGESGGRDEVPASLRLCDMTRLPSLPPASKSARGGPRRALGTPRDSSGGTTGTPCHGPGQAPSPSLQGALGPPEGGRDGNQPPSSAVTHYSLMSTMAGAATGASVRQSLRPPHSGLCTGGGEQRALR